jgi:hypothetical protein
MDLVAADLLERAANLAPILTGDLIKSGSVRGRTTARTISRTVGFGTDHAVFTHEGIYNLGPESRRKPSTEDGPVGRKYLVRPYRRHVARYQRFIATRLRRDVLEKARG